MPEDMVWYFAYGSNLDIFQMMKRVGDWKTARRAYAEGYQLVFDKESSKNWGGYTANIHRGNPSDRVYGVVYELRRSKLSVLAEYEAMRATSIDVKLMEDNSPLSASVFIFEPSGKSGRIPKAYENAIIDGLLQHNFSKDIIQGVVHIIESSPRNNLTDQNQETHYDIISSIIVGAAATMLALLVSLMSGNSLVKSVIWLRVLLASEFTTLTLTIILGLYSLFLAVNRRRNATEYTAIVLFVSVVELFVIGLGILYP